MHRILIITTGIVGLAFCLLSFTTPKKEVYTLSPSASQFKWTGYHLVKSYEHWGYIQFKSGKIELENGEIVSGEFSVDMQTMRCEDIKDMEDNAKLIGHLKNEDFFDVKKYPESKLVITKSTKMNKMTHRVVADLTIKGKTKEVNFDMNISFPNEQTINASVDMKVQRTDFGVMYGWNLTNAVLSDEFRSELKLVAKK